jgi:two-component system, OmpR family, sensor kinase
MTSAPYSLRIRLLTALAAVISLATLIQASIAYKVAQREVGVISDYHMIQMAHAVRRGMPDPALQVTPTDLQTELSAHKDRSFSLRVTPLSAEEIALLPTTGYERGFSTRKIGDTTFRVFALCTKSKKIEVLHDMATRNANASRLALRTAFPILILAPLLLLFVWLGTSRALRPLLTSRNEIARRAPNDLHALQTDDVPDELLPFINEINSLFQRISQAFAAQQNFVSYAAHELRSPLTALRLQVQGLQRAASAEARQLATERVIGGIDRATRLIEQLLILARAEATGEETTQTDLLNIARLAMSDVYPLAQARHTDLGAEFAEGTPESAFVIMGNIEALRTLLRNLLENAVKYAPEHGVVNLVLENRDSEGNLLLSVEDNGPGILPEEREIVFERFRRGAGHHAEGCGLGLSIVKTIADRHHISIALGESRKLGGLSVILRFPPMPKSSDRA